MAIQSFAVKATERFFNTGQVSKGVGWSNIASVAKRKLDMVEYSAALSDLRVPPNNRLEALRGELAGCHSIRVNNQWRIVFRWTAAGPAEVRICDYHS